MIHGLIRVQPYEAGVIPACGKWETMAAHLKHCPNYAKAMPTRHLAGFRSSQDAENIPPIFSDSGPVLVLPRLAPQAGASPMTVKFSLCGIPLSSLTLCGLGSSPTQSAFGTPAKQARTLLDLLSPSCASVIAGMRCVSMTLQQIYASCSLCAIFLGMLLIVLR